MCARLYLNGDGIGKDSHVSLFFVLMKGHYDAILSWPFTHRVTMLLRDQSGQNNHVQEKFRSDPNSSSFQRPQSEMNIATGCPRFISKTDLDRRKTLYIKDNTMFIQIVIHDLAIQGSRISTFRVFIYFAWNIPVSATDFFPCENRSRCCMPISKYQCLICIC